MLRAAAIAIGLVGCGGSRTTMVAPGPDIQIVGEASRIRFGDPHATSTPWFDGKSVTLVAARGETIGIQISHRSLARVTLSIRDATVHGFSVGLLPVTRPSTAMYGGSRGAGKYADALEPNDAPASDPAYFEIVATTPGVHAGELVVGDATFPVVLSISTFEMPHIQPAVWAYEDPREFAWAAKTAATGDPANPAAASLEEQRCQAMFREHGVALSPELDLDSAVTPRATVFEGMGYLPVTVGDDPSTIGANVAKWIELTRGSRVPFAIPIDEPHDHESRMRVRALADAARAAGSGPEKFLFAVTDAPHDEYGQAVDLFISSKAAHLSGDAYQRWTYNGTPPAAGSMVLDATTPGARTWGWIMYRYNIPVWYVWDALYWHDRHNRKRHGVELPGRALDATKDAVSFDDNEDHGNLDGVLALPGCRRTLRLASIRRGLLDRTILQLADHCDPGATRQIASELVPRALADASGAGPSWPTDEGAWELARRKLLVIAATCPPRP